MLDTTRQSPENTIPGDAALDALRRRDELLSLLYWLRADRLSEAPALAELACFMGETPLLTSDLDGLVEAGLVALIAHGEAIQLTAAGVAEGQRRFEEEVQAPAELGIAGNAHEVMVGVCGPNARCVREGQHGECAEPELVFPPQAYASPGSSTDGGQA